MRYYAYCRTSTETQKKRNGCSMQISEIEEYCKDNDISIQEWFIDEAISGTVSDRPELVRLLSVIKNSDIVIVWDISRLWRSETVKSIIQYQLVNKGADIISLNQPRYSIYDKSSLNNAYFDLLNTYDRFNTVLTLSKGRRRLAKEGKKPCGTTPIGYKWADGEIKIDSKNSVIVKEIFEKYIELQSLGKVKAYCDSHGYKTANGKEFSRAALKNIIENDFYIGVVTYAGKKVSGNHPVFINEHLFNQANLILKRGSR